ncbi:MAG: DNA-protecting protein DprA [Candidatus Nitrohelix vancouverensis]|uniref:DNA-protecting protein DprA n=1 Tax=Candidatus Nitrohelix vancouverensis TaxID=2705534 RepID=A0A7T0C3U6_9BACT|nr:MAG: DNA-protecting protein DprA [Candidatus Nitrohelix vancouverensis]
MVLGVGKTLFRRLVTHLGSPKAVFYANRNQLLEVEGIGAKTAQEILNFEVERKTEREFSLVDKLGGRIITWEDDEYPALLKSIYDPPPVIYCQGLDLRSLAFPIAVVGARSPTSYGKHVTNDLCQALASKGFSIVSGFARGIDTCAHRAALKAGGKTAAVFGCGLAQTYPPENSGLREQLLEHGALISEFPVTMGPERNNFPARNRIISGMSLGTLVVEAGEKSGALITAQFAVEQGREVFAVPGNISSPKSRGPNALIQTGAKLVNSVDSILEEMPFEVQEALTQKPQGATLESKHAFTEKEQSLVALLMNEESHIDRLIENSGLSAGEVSATLLQLELKGVVRQLDGNVYAAIC